MRLNASLGCSSSAALLFESPTIALIASELADLDLAPPMPALAPIKVSEPQPSPAKPTRAPVQGLQAIPVAPYGPEQRQAGLPCSFNQEQMIAISMQPSGLSYNQFFVFELAGMVSVEMLQRALDVVVNRHEALRTCFRMTPQGPRQIVIPASEPLMPPDPLLFFGSSCKFRFSSCNT